MTKISIQQLASLIPDSIFGNDEETKTAFVRLVFETISGRLAEGESVDVPGLGRFQRTGDAGDPLLFDQDKAFSQAVNAPFASFRPEPLAAEVTESMLDETVPVNESVEENMEEPAPEDVPQPAAFVVMEPEVPVVEEVAAVEELPAVQEPAEVITAPEPEIEESVSEPEASPEKIEPAGAEPTQPTPEPVAPACEAEMSGHEEIHEPEEEISTTSTGGSRFSSGFFCGFIAGLAVGAIAFLVYIIIDINKPSPSESEVEEEISETEQMVDSLSILME